MASWDEASRCPKCEQVGEEEKSINHGRKKTVTLICKNTACRWYNTGWAVTILEDGSIPDPAPREKSFPAVSPFVQSMAVRQLEEMALADPSIIPSLPIPDERKLELAAEANRRRAMG